MIGKLAMGFVAYPIFLKYLNSFEVSIYLLIISSVSFYEILDFSFTNSLIRYFSYAEGGLTRDNDYGLDNIAIHGEDLFANLLLMAKSYYRYLCLFCFVTIGIGFSIYLYFFTHIHQKNFLYYELNWLFYSLGTLLGVYFMHLTPALIGKGQIDKINKIALFTKAIMVIIQCSLVAYIGIMALVAGSFISIIIERILLIKLFNQHVTIDKSIRFDKLKFLRILKLFWHNNYRMGLIGLIYLFIIKINLFIAGYAILDTVILSKYLFTMQIFAIISVVARVPVANNLADMSAYFISNQQQTVDIFLKHNKHSLQLYSMMSLGVLFFGTPLAYFLGIKHSFLSNNFLIVIIIINLFDVQLQNCVMVLNVYNDTSMLKSYFISAIAIFSISIICTLILHLGVFGLILPQLLVQIAYNYWYWVRYSLRRMAITSRQYLASLIM